MSHRIDLTRAAIEAFFNHIDINQDGSISLDELCDGINIEFIGNIQNYFETIPSLMIPVYPKETIGMFDQDRNTTFELNEITAVIESCIERLANRLQHWLFRDQEDIRNMCRLLFNAFFEQRDPNVDHRIQTLLQKLAEERGETLHNDFAQRKQMGLRASRIEVRTCAPLKPREAVSGRTLISGSKAPGRTLVSGSKAPSSVPAAAHHRPPPPRPVIICPAWHTVRSRPTAADIERHNRGNFNADETAQLQQEAILHARELQRLHPENDEDGTDRCSDYIIGCVISHDNIDPQWNNTLIMYIYGHLDGVLARKVNETIEYRGGMLNKINKKYSQRNKKTAQKNSRNKRIRSKKNMINKKRSNRKF